LSWLLYFPQLDGASTARVRAWRRLQKLGAISLQGGVWVLPESKATRASLAWVQHELGDSGIKGFTARAAWLEGLTDAELKRQFVQQAKEGWSAFVAEGKKARPETAEALARKFEELAARDFFSAEGRSEAQKLVRALGGAKTRRAEVELSGRTWVTRKDVHVDRITSAWLIRRFIDAKARFKFVDLSLYAHRPGELRFDMQDAEFTHQGKRCTFEVLQHRFARHDKALVWLGELVHDLDFEDDRFQHPEAAGFGSQLNAIAEAHPADLARIERASAMLDDLYAARKKPLGGK
jgi:hypothetical protein